MRYGELDPYGNLHSLFSHSSCIASVHEKELCRASVFTPAAHVALQVLAMAETL